MNGSNSTSFAHLYPQFHAKRLQQSSDNARPCYSSMDEGAAQAVFDVSTVAMQAVADGSRDIALRAVSLATGVGKSTSAWAFIAAAYEADPNFSCAYVCQTIKQAEEAQEGIEALLGNKPATVLWSAYHKHRNRDDAKTIEALGYLPTRRADKASLPTDRIVIVSHRLLADEIANTRDFGVRCYYGKPRSVVYIDEHPELNDLVTVQPHDVMRLHDRVHTVNPEHPWLPILRNVSEYMAEIMQEKGQAYEPVRLLTPAQGKLFDGAHDQFVQSLTDAGPYLEVREQQMLSLLQATKFLSATGRGCTFYSRHDGTFSSYRLNFDDTYAGYVLLDATADLSGIVVLNPLVRTHNVRQVDYSNLSIVHVKQPTKFKYIPDVCKKAKTGREYGTWIMETVIANSKPGDDILLVCHLAVLDGEFITPANDPAHPLVIEGRRINTCHYGSEVGMNRWKHKTTVMMFGEWYPKGSTTVATYHAWSEQPMTTESLKLAEGRRMHGAEFAPQGAYRPIHEGHLLRWCKQLASRGSVRNIQPDGKCGRMTLVTTMDRERLVQNLPRLFPEASLPTQGDTTATPSKTTGRAALIDLLMGAEKALYGADEVQRITGILPRNLRRDIEAPAVATIAQAYGWALKSAPEVGKPSRMLYLTQASTQ